MNLFWFVRAHFFFSICHLSWGWIYHSLCPGIDGSSGAISHLLTQKQHNASQMELFDVLGLGVCSYVSVASKKQQSGFILY